MTKAGLLRVGARDVTLAWIANGLTGANPLGRQMIDHTGLSGGYDFAIEFTPQYHRPLPPGSPEFNEDGPSFIQALNGQLGLKLKAAREALDTIVIDHVERPSEN